MKKLPSSSNTKEKGIISSRKIKSLVSKATLALSRVMGKTPTSAKEKGKSAKKVGKKEPPMKKMVSKEVEIHTKHKQDCGKEVATTIEGGTIRKKMGKISQKIATEDSSTVEEPIPTMALWVGTHGSSKKKVASSQSLKKGEKWFDIVHMLHACWLSNCMF